MSEANVDLPDQVITDLNQLVESGDFASREQAIDELLSLGIDAYMPRKDDDDADELMFDDSITDQFDPAADDQDRLSF